MTDEQKFQHLLKVLKGYANSAQFYRNRCELLQKVQKYMRDPERQIVCDILANNSLLPDPSGVRYGQDLVKLID
jgi:elongation factor P--beta-lysine ligase